MLPTLGLSFPPAAWTPLGLCDMGLPGRSLSLHQAGPLPCQGVGTRDLNSLPVRGERETGLAGLWVTCPQQGHGEQWPGTGSWGLAERLEDWGRGPPGVPFKGFPGKQQGRWRAVCAWHLGVVPTAPPGQPGAATGLHLQELGDPRKHLGTAWTLLTDRAWESKRPTISVFRAGCHGSAGVAPAGVSARLCLGPCGHGSACLF